MTSIDYDLSACLKYNPQNFSENDIQEVLAVVEGEHDGANWHWVLQLKTGYIVYLTGGCCYTGWDCQSWATADIINVNSYSQSIVGTDNLSLLDDHLRVYSGMVCNDLIEQIRNGKNETWRESADKKLEVNSFEALALKAKADKELTTIKKLTITVPYGLVRFVSDGRISFKIMSEDLDEFCIVMEKLGINVKVDN